MQAPYINAGQSAYGLAQMTILAEKLIPAYRPKYVMVQYSPWLVSRALSPFSPTVFFADITFPYLTMEKDSIALKPPLFESGLYTFDSERYRLSPSSITDKIRFYYDYGVKVVLHDLIHKYAYLLRNNLGENKAPVASGQAELFLYRRIFAVAHQYNCKVYVVNIGSILDQPVSKGLFDGERVINTDSILKATAHGDAKTYQKLFYHWAMLGKDTVIADVHPNPYAHSIIAGEIYRRINADK
jgi:hypothetical protein